MITDAELNEIINTPKPKMNHDYANADMSLYSAYFDSHKFWKSMNKRRMIELCDVIIKKATNIRGTRLIEVEQARASLIYDVNSGKDVL